MSLFGRPREGQETKPRKGEAMRGIRSRTPAKSTLQNKRPSGPDVATNGTAPKSPPKAGIVPVFFDSDKGGYYTSNAHGEFHRMSTEILKLLLQSKGYSRLQP